MAAEPGQSGHQQASSSAGQGHRQQGSTHASAPPRRGSSSTASAAGGHGHGHASSSNTLVGGGTSSSSSSGGGGGGGHGGGSSGNSRSTRSSSSGGQSGAGFDTVDAVCSAIQTTALTSADYATRYRLVKESLLPALVDLETHGTAAGVPGSMVLQSALQGGADPLIALMQQPQLTGNGVGYLFILLARCAAENPNLQTLHASIDAFCQVADTNQLRLVPHKVNLLAQWTAWLFRSSPRVAVVPIYRLLLRYSDRFPNHLTGLHQQLLLQCLRACDMETALDFLSRYPVLEVEQRFFPVTYQDNLKYHLFAGTVFAVVGDYSKAVDLLETAVTAPALSGSTSLLQVDAYKRWTLAHLLADGKVPSLPKYTSSHLLQQFKQLFSASYLDFSKIYESLDSSRLHILANSQKVIFEADGNWGLVSRCLEALPSRNLLKLQETYRTVSVLDAARLVGFARHKRPSGVAGQSGASSSEADGGSSVDPDRDERARASVVSAVHNLVAEGKLAARIVASTQAGSDELFIEFLSEQPSSSSTSASLSQSLFALAATSQHVSALDARLSSSRDFLSKAYNAASRASGYAGRGAGGGQDSMDMIGFGGEEDLMAGSGSQIIDEWDEE